MIFQPLSRHFTIPSKHDRGRSETPFSGNIIPLSQINPTASKILNSSLYPLPTNSNLTSNLTYQAHSYTNGDQGDIRGDYNKSDNDHFFVRYSQADITNPSTNSLPLIYGGFGNFRIHNGAIDYTRDDQPHARE